jgi:hypothetical protein
LALGSRHSKQADCSIARSLSGVVDYLVAHLLVARLVIGPIDQFQVAALWNLAEEKWEAVRL